MSVIICGRCGSAYSGYACPQCGSKETITFGGEKPTTALPPLRVAYSREEIAAKLKDWMIELWGDIPKNLDPEQRDKWYRDNGLIYHFICDHFPENSETPKTNEHNT